MDNVTAALSKLTSVATQSGTQDTELNYDPSGLNVQTFSSTQANLKSSLRSDLASNVRRARFRGAAFVLASPATSPAAGYAAASAEIVNEARAFDGVGIHRRWAGLGPHPKGLREQLPRSVSNAKDDELAEIEGIVEHREVEGTYHYLVRYKNYSEEWDEWLGEEALETAPGAIKEYWARNALASK
jgi:hypothetical protein